MNSAQLMSVNTHAMGPQTRPMHDRARPTDPPPTREILGETGKHSLQAEERLDAESAGDETVSALDHV